MQARMKHPVTILPQAMQALLALNAAVEKAGVPKQTLELVHVRASQINGCGLCLDMHTRLMQTAGETDQRLFALAAWRDTPYFSDAERAALALAESVTRLSDREDPVPDYVWNEVTRHYDEAGRAALLVAIGTINVWNRLNVSTRQVAGTV